jgi:hypothetical protein
MSYHRMNIFIDDCHQRCSTSLSSLSSSTTSTIALESRRQKHVDNQQQTQIYPTRINVGTSTQCQENNESMLVEHSWFDVMKEDPTTVNAWSRIRRRLKPDQQKDILRQDTILDYSYSTHTHVNHVASLVRCVTFMSIADTTDIFLTSTRTRTHDLYCYTRSHTT